MAILEIENLTVWYESLFGDIKALDRCSLSIDEGQMTCILGVNGAGKTTLFKTISGVVDDFDGNLTTGRVLFRGEDISGYDPSKIVSRGIGHSPQDRHLFFTLPVEDNLLLGAYLKRRSKGAAEKINKSMEDVFSLFPVLKERRDQKAGKLSGGEQQMLSIGRAMMSEPELLLLDEPLMGLAPIVIEEIKESLKEVKERGITLLVGEQNVIEILDVADWGHVIEDGFIVASGASGELMNSRQIREVFLGEGLA
jgi:branched-chain amino acid transport system ATP-binding protein